VLELQGLTRRYGDLVVLDDLSFTVREGQMFGFLGPNGRRQDHRHADRA
jgi:ABC-2 type transport system ATP-binding protein